MIGIKYQMIRSKIPWLNAFWASVCRSYRLNKKLKELIRTEHADIIQFTSLNAVSLLYTGKVPAVMRLSSYTKKQNPIVDALDRGFHAGTGGGQEMQRGICAEQYNGKSV